MYGIPSLVHISNTCCPMPTCPRPRVPDVNPIMMWGQWRIQIFGSRNLRYGYIELEICRLA
jgi:hypothetical protein